MKTFKELIGHDGKLDESTSAEEIAELIVEKMDSINDLCEVIEKKFKTHLQHLQLKKLEMRCIC